MDRRKGYDFFYYSREHMQDNRYQFCVRKGAGKVTLTPGGVEMVEREVINRQPHPRGCWAN
jgi:hypothetical protein